MDFTQFDQQAKDDPDISAFVQELASEITPAGPTENSERYVVVVDDVLIASATYVLFRWTKDYFDDRRDKNETKIAENRARMIKDLVADGFTPEQAQSTVAGLFKQIAKRSEDDPVFQKVSALIPTHGS